MSYSLGAAELEDIRSSYEEELAGLTFNSKPIINMLTTIAQENINAAAVICKTIEDRVHSAPPTHKLPVMYLLDSISKNVGSPFTPIFGRNLYKTFMGCYTAVDNNTRRSLEALFSTWKLPVAGSNSSFPVYPPEDTRKIDAALLQIRALQERNPMYQQYAQSQSRFGIPQQYPQVQQIPAYSNSAAYLDTDPYRQSPPLQMRGSADSSMYASHSSIHSPGADAIISDIEGLLRTLETRARVNPDDIPTNTFITSLRGLHEMLRTQILRPLQLEEIRDQLRKVAVFCAQPIRPAHRPNSPSPAFPISQPVSNDLFAQLAHFAKAGIIPGSGANTPIPMPGALQAPTLTSIYVELTSSAMLQSRPELIDLLYNSMPLQCFQCGQRWKDTPENRAAKDEHLDWHFRTNKRLREHSVRAQSRALYLSENDWINFSISESNDPEHKIEAVKGPDLSTSTVPKPSDPALHDSVCPVCKEPFITDWDDSSEDWIWKNAIDVNGTIYHATCHADTLAAQKKAIAANTMVKQEEHTADSDAYNNVDDGDDDDEDIALPTAAGAAVKLENEQDSAVPEEVTKPFVLADALQSLSGTLNALSGLKRKASEEAEDTEDGSRRIKVEPDT